MLRNCIYSCSPCFDCIFSLSNHYCTKAWTCDLDETGERLKLTFRCGCEPCIIPMVLSKVNVLADDINVKVTTIDPLSSQCCADLSLSVSDASMTMLHISFSFHVKTIEQFQFCRLFVFDEIFPKNKENIWWLILNPFKVSFQSAALALF